ncbi:hypothetical protein VTL71DRAFT_492 [Oculimacula yallundae]|uniref:Uncharacterized protein n=1 Tax=Oculimacula yallundae TaxID=86028 RepID=A0ABR4D089_9HELO
MHQSPYTLRLVHGESLACFEQLSRQGRAFNYWPTTFLHALQTLPTAGISTHSFPVNSKTFRVLARIYSVPHSLRRPKSYGRRCLRSVAALFAVSSALCPTRLYDPSAPIIEKAYTHRNDHRLARPQNKQATQHSSAFWKHRCIL